MQAKKNFLIILLIIILIINPLFIISTMSVWSFLDLFTVLAEEANTDMEIDDINKKDKILKDNLFTSLAKLSLISFIVIIF